MAKRKKPTEQTPDLNQILGFGGSSSSASQPAGRSAAAATVHTIKISLKGIKPPIWRRVLVQDCTLAEFHEVIQRAMGWDGFHLHEFLINGAHVGDPSLCDEMDSERDSRKILLSQLVAEKSKSFEYEYDFGDSWTHTIKIEKTQPVVEGETYPRCLEGERACPPEDCGGAWGYQSILERLARPAGGSADDDEEDDEDFDEEDFRGFDPERFDLDEVNAALASLRAPRRRRGH